MTRDDLNPEEFDAVMRIDAVLAKLDPEQQERVIRKLAAAEGVQFTDSGPAIDLRWLLDLPEVTIGPGGHSQS